MHSNFILTVLVLILFFACTRQQSSVDQPKEKDSLTLKNSEEPRVQLANTLVHELPSAFTKTTYDIYISYPVNYKMLGKKYPLLVVLDAEVNFGATKYITERLIKDELIPELIIVGIAYKGDTDEDTYYSIRGRDLTPTADPERQYRFGNGGAENFVKFISEELFPYLTSNYPIQEKGKSLYGHSFGGLFGTHVLLNHPALFDNYLLLSPSLWWKKQAIMQNVKLDSSIATQQIKLYFGSGSLERGIAGDQLEMVKSIKRLNSKNISIKSEILDNETHRTVFGRGFTNALRFVFEK